MHSPELRASRQQQRERAMAIASNLNACLSELDKLDEGLAAVHVSMALELLKTYYRLEL
jgi:hypothetical protein